MGADAEGINAQEVTDQVAGSSHHRTAMPFHLCQRAMPPVDITEK